MQETALQKHKSKGYFNHLNIFRPITRHSKSKKEKYAYLQTKIILAKQKAKKKKLKTQNTE